MPYKHPMTTLADFPITRRWPPQHPDRLQLYSATTPNGVKVSIMLEIEDKRPLERYRNEARRLLGVLETRLEGRAWIMGDDYTIADISLLGWVRNLIGFYGARDLVGFDELRRVPLWLEHGLMRPAVERGLAIPARS